MLQFIKNISENNTSIFNPNIFQTEINDSDDQQTNQNLKSFEYIDISGNYRGRYYANSPEEAVNKVYARIYQIAKLNQQNLEDKIFIHLKESTKGSDKQCYSFEVLPAQNSSDIIVQKIALPNSLKFTN